MFKSIPGNQDYEISLTLQLRRLDGEECTLPVIGNDVTITMFENELTVDLSWLSLVAHFELDSLEAVMSAYFGDHPNKLTSSTSGKWIFFKTPLVTKEGYREIPGFSRYCITSTGDLIHKETGEVPTRHADNVNGYATSWIYDPEISKNRSVRHHRLVALAWKKNKDPWMRNIVDHLNGDRSNFDSTNLQWVTNRENIRRALVVGTRQTVDCTVREIETGVVTRHYSISSACEYMGLNVRGFETLTSGRREGTVLDKFEIRINGDDTPWAFVDRTIDSNSRYEITVEGDGDLPKLFYGQAIFRSTYGLHNLHPATVHNLAKVLMERNPDLKVTIVDRDDSRQIQAKNIVTGEVITSPTLATLGRRLNLSRQSIRSYTHRGPSEINKGYQFRRETSEPWPTVTKYVESKSKCIIGLDMETKLETEYPSIHAASNQTGQYRGSIRVSLNENRPVNGIHFRLKIK